MMLARLIRIQISKSKYYFEFTATWLPESKQKIASEQRCHKHGSLIRPLAGKHFLPCAPWMTQSGFLQVAGFQRAADIDVWPEEDPQTPGRESNICYRSGFKTSDVVDM